MKKLICAVIAILLVSVFLVACVDYNPHIDRYSIEAGRKAIAQAKDSPMPKQAERIPSPNDCSIEYPYEDLGIAVISKKSDQTDEGESAVYLYGMSDFEGNVLVECVYSSLERSGDFFMGKKEEEDIEADEFCLYYKSQYLFATPNFITRFVAIDKDYFALYTKENSVVYSKEGRPLLGNSQMTSEYDYSICGKYLFAQDAEAAVYIINEIIGNAVTHHKSYISTQAVYYAVCYLGQSEFLVVKTALSTDKDYDYYEIMEGNKYYYRQTATILEENKSEKRVQLEFLIIAVANKYSPTIDYDTRGSLNLQSGYSAVLTHTLNKDKQRVGQDYYVMNKECINVLKMPITISPFALVFKNNVGFAGNALDNYAAALFSLDMQVIWENKETNYYAQSFNDNKYVLAKSVDNQLKYGCLDIDGEAIFDFQFDFLATFTEGYSVALTEGEYYRVDDRGNILEKLNDIRVDNTQFAFNSYIYENEGKQGLKNYRGDILIEAKYDSVYFQGYIGNSLYVIFNYADTTEVFRVV